MHSQEKTQKLSGKMATCAIFVSLASSWGDRWTEHVERYETHHLLVRERYFFILSFVLLLLLHKTDICVYFNCFDTVPLHPQHLFSFLLCVCDWHCAEQNQKMNGEETQGIQKKLTFIWHVIDVKSVNQMNFRIFPPLYRGFYHLSALCFGCNACSFIKDSPKS